MKHVRLSVCLSVCLNLNHAPLNYFLKKKPQLPSIVLLHVPSNVICVQQVLVYLGIYFIVPNAYKL